MITAMPLRQQLREVLRGVLALYRAHPEYLWPPVIFLVDRATLRRHAEEARTTVERNRR